MNPQHPDNEIFAPLSHFQRGAVINQAMEDLAVSGTHVPVEREAEFYQQAGTIISNRNLLAAATEAQLERPAKEVMWAASILAHLPKAGNLR